MTDKPDDPSAVEILDMIWEALMDSMGPDWNSRIGARAVLQRLTDEGLVIVPASFFAALAKAIQP